MATAKPSSTPSRVDHAVRPRTGNFEAAPESGVFPVIVKAEGCLWRDDASAPMIDAVSEEVPVALTYNGVSHAVMMATPADIEDFALGFSLSEGILECSDEFLDLEIDSTPRGIVARVAISARRFAALRNRRRSLAGRTGCGLCGVDSLEQAVRSVAPIHSSFVVGVGAIRHAVNALPEHQVLNRVVRSLHAAAWADADGSIRFVKEDVGRHNALDKLIGTLAARGVDTANGFCVVTSRCSYEMVQKAATAGISTLVAVSAPTALAVRMARSLNLTVVASARTDSFRVYSHGGRIAAADGTDDGDSQVDDRSLEHLTE